ncbi:MAG: hypothetical protein JXA54_09375 [Candidatus Heimdallarchaeota archaeon]|nr:hypothetical protein [Candidatus Heimdallarchaeota archaeon]
MKALHEIFPELENLFAKFSKNADIQLANEIGQLLAFSQESIEYKKEYYSQLFNLPLKAEIDAVINAWAVASLIEDNIPIPQKVQAARLMLNDFLVPEEVLEKWVEFVWVARRAPRDLLNFLAIDFTNSKRISKKYKEIIK